MDGWTDISRFAGFRCKRVGRLGRGERDAASSSLSVRLPFKENVCFVSIRFVGDVAGSCLPRKVAETLAQTWKALQASSCSNERRTCRCRKPLPPFLIPYINLPYTILSAHHVHVLPLLDLDVLLANLGSHADGSTIDGKQECSLALSSLPRHRPRSPDYLRRTLFPSRGSYINTCPVVAFRQT